MDNAFELRKRTFSDNDFETDLIENNMVPKQNSNSTDAFKKVPYLPHKPPESLFDFNGINRNLLDNECERFEMKQLERQSLLDANADISDDASSVPETVAVKETISDESSWVIAFQVVFPFLIAGCGTVGAGLVLDVVQHWRVFTEVSEIFILVPALLGLKGNLEMTLASRLSTQANLGRLDTAKQKVQHIIGNLALIQAQAMVVAFLASIFAVILGWVLHGTINWNHVLLLCATSMATAALASLALGLVMVAVILVSRYLHINPDNVATPIAASLGDLTTLSILAIAGSLLNNVKTLTPYLAIAIIVLCLLVTPLWMYISAKNEHTVLVLINGWSPVLFSMLISSVGGFILDITVSTYRGIAVFQPVINGIGGNLVAVQASRISTSLHKASVLGILPANAPRTYSNPCSVFCGSNIHSRACRVLLLLVVPGHLIFMYMIHFLRAGHTTITPMFAVMYLSACLIQVALLLYLCVWMVYLMWRCEVDPDNSAIPYLTALGDLLGTGLLALSFHLLYLIGDKDLDVGE